MTINNKRSKSRKDHERENSILTRFRKWGMLNVLICSTVAFCVFVNTNVAGIGAIVYVIILYMFLKADIRHLVNVYKNGGQNASLLHCARCYLTDLFPKKLNYIRLGFGTDKLQPDNRFIWANPGSLYVLTYLFSATYVAVIGFLEFVDLPGLHFWFQLTEPLTRLVSTFSPFADNFVRDAQGAGFTHRILLVTHVFSVAVLLAMLTAVPPVLFFHKMLPWYKKVPKKNLWQGKSHKYIFSMITVSAFFTVGIYVTIFMDSHYGVNHHLVYGFNFHVSNTSLLFLSFMITTVITLAPFFFLFTIYMIFSKTLNLMGITSSGFFDSPTDDKSGDEKTKKETPTKNN